MSADKRPPRRKSPRAAPMDDGEEVGYAARAPERVRRREEPEPDEIENILVRRKRPRAPRFPLWQGVYDFPWQPSGLRAWFLFGIGLTMVALLGAGLHYVIDLYLAGGPGSSIWVRVMILYITAFAVFLLWTGTFASGFLLEAIQDTASGNPEVKWPDDSISEKFFTLLYVAWIFLCAAVPFGIAAAPFSARLGSVVFAWSLVPTCVFVLPFVLLSALANNSWLMFWNIDVVGKLLSRPVVLLIIYVMTTLLLALCVGLGYLIVMHYQSFVFLSPVAGFAWSACLLIYARLLGRVAWIISGEQELALQEARRTSKRRSAGRK